MKADVYRNGKVHVCARKCDSCIFRPGNLMHLTEGRRDGLVAGSIKDGGCIPCHETLEADGEAVCRGFFDIHKHDIQALQVAERLQMIEWQEPPEDWMNHE